MASVMIWKYFDEEMRFYFNYKSDGTGLPTYVDRIQLNNITEDGFPVFDMKVEAADGLLQYTAGNFKMNLSLLHTETSVNGDGLYDFLFDGKANKYLTIIHFNDACCFQGFFTSADIRKALTYSTGNLHVEIQTYGPLTEFAESFSLPNQGTRITSSDLTFESYIRFHFDVNPTFNFLFPDDLGYATYKQRVGDNTVVFSGFMQTQLATAGEMCFDVKITDDFTGNVSFAFSQVFEDSSSSQYDVPVSISQLHDIINITSQLNESNSGQTWKLLESSIKKLKIKVTQSASGTGFIFLVIRGSL